MIVGRGLRPQVTEYQHLTTQHQAARTAAEGEAAALRQQLADLQGQLQVGWGESERLRAGAGKWGTGMDSSDWDGWTPLTGGTVMGVLGRVVSYVRGCPRQGMAPAVLAPVHP